MTYVEITVKAIQRLIINELRDARGTHVETAIAAISALAGLRVLMDVNHFFSQNPTVDRNKYFDETIDTKGKQILEQIISIVIKLKVPFDPEKVLDPIPLEHLPQLNIQNLIDKFQKPCWEIFSKKNISPQEHPFILAFATAGMIKSTEHLLDPTIGMIIATRTIVEVCKTFDLKTLLHT